MSLGITRKTFSSALEVSAHGRAVSAALQLHVTAPDALVEGFFIKKKILLSGRNKTSAPGKFIPLVGVDKFVCSFTRAFGVLFNRTQTGSKRCCLSGFPLPWQDAIHGLLCCVYTDSSVVFHLPNVFTFLASSSVPSLVTAAKPQREALVFRSSSSGLPKTFHQPHIFYSTHSQVFHGPGPWQSCRAQRGQMRSSVGLLYRQGNRDFLYFFTLVPTHSCSSKRLSILRTV